MICISPIKYCDKRYPRTLIDLNCCSLKIHFICVSLLVFLVAWRFSGPIKIIRMMFPSFFFLVPVPTNRNGMNVSLKKCTMPIWKDVPKRILLSFGTYHRSSFTTTTTTQDWMSCMFFWYTNDEKKPKHCCLFRRYYLLLVVLQVQRRDWVL